jgi:hypothetical protein
MNRPVPHFDPYGQPPPAGDWEYVLDDFGVSYGPGWWPLYRDGTPCGVRLAPDTEYRSWRNEYVTLRPGTGARTVAQVTLYCRRQGLGAMVLDARIGIDLRERTVTVVSDLSDCPDEVRQQAHDKAAKLLRFLLAQRHARRTGATRPVTAYELWESRPTSTGS